ncbi:MAG: helix-turn-helix domain-containing protein [Lysobacterales bacterium]
MPRPTRIEVAGGWYHVANRGAGRQRIFRNDEHRQIFLDLLQSLEPTFGVEVHAYCLMSNRFDLMVHTTHANLSRSMRHIGGVYTQRYNRLSGRDGPLFRGRFRAVLFEPQTALLGVSRHLHRRPLVTGMVQRLDRYRWSSYPSFVTSRRKPEWLRRDAVLVAAGCQPDDRNSARVYRQYVERDGESNELVRQYYRSRRPGAVLGSETFVRQALAGQEQTAGARASIPGIPPRRIIRVVADHFEVTRRSILTSSRGRTNLPRMAALWLCRKHSQLTLEQLARHFGLAGFGSVSGALHRAGQHSSKVFWEAIEQVEQQIALER